MKKISILLLIIISTFVAKGQYVTKTLYGDYVFKFGGNSVLITPSMKSISTDTIRFADGSKMYSAGAMGNFVSVTGDTMTGRLSIHNGGTLRVKSVPANSYIDVDFNTLTIYGDVMGNGRSTIFTRTGVKFDDNDTWSVKNEAGGNIATFEPDSTVTFSGKVIIPDTVIANNIYANAYLFNEWSDSYLSGVELYLENENNSISINNFGAPLISVGYSNPFSNLELERELRMETYNRGISYDTIGMRLYHTDYRVINEVDNGRFYKLGIADSSMTIYNKLILESPSDTMLSVRGDVNITGTLTANNLITPDTISIGDIYNEYYAPIYYTTSGTLSKTDRVVLASGDITLTAPAITAADSGLMITVKNIGTHTDLVLFRIDGTTADGIDTARLLRWQTRTIIAGNDGKWYTYEKSNRTDYVYDVSASGSFTTIHEVIEFLSEHMEAPSVVRLGGGDYPIDSRIEIDLPYPLTIRGFSYQTTFIYPSGSISGAPMFQCNSPVSFENFQADATRLAGYGDELYEDFVTFGSIFNHEIKNFYLKGFYDGITVEFKSEVYVQEGDIEDCNNSGIMINSQQDSTVMRVVTTDFIGCDKGIYLYRGDKAYIDIDGGCGFRNKNATDSAIVYNPTQFTNFRNIYISGTTWNNIGSFISGFDFTRADGRDANAFITNNAGVESKNPHAHINVLNNATTTTVTTAGTYYKANFTNTTSYTCKFGINNNKLTYQPTNKRDLFFTISGNLSVNQTNRNVEVCIVKNGQTATRYGQFTVRTQGANLPNTFAISPYISDASATDYFEIYITSSGSGDIVTLQDVQITVNSQ